MQEQIYFEDVTVGDDLPTLHKGPLTSAHLMRWSAATENWHKIHYDVPFTTEHDKLPALLINGSLKQQFIMQALRDYVGRSGWVWKVFFQFRALNVVGETLEVWSRVEKLERAEQFGLIHLELGIRNADGKESTPGNAVIALPYRDGEPVPYPFKPPQKQQPAPRL